MITKAPPVRPGSFWFAEGSILPRPRNLDLDPPVPRMRMKSTITRIRKRNKPDQRPVVRKLLSRCVMRNILPHLSCSPLCGLLDPRKAGEGTVERREFKQSQSYPYVFRPVCYLATSGPVPLRFSVSPPECGDRRPPKLPDKAKNTPKPEAPARCPHHPSLEPAPTPSFVHSHSCFRPPAPAYPPPTNAPAPKPPTVDFSQFPAELVEAFKKRTRIVRHPELSVRPHLRARRSG